MNLLLDIGLTVGYKSASQKARVMTQHWVRSELPCPSCGRRNLSGYPENAPVADFFCAECSEDYELKSQTHIFGSRVADGAYSRKIERLLSDRNPNLVLLRYSPLSLEVMDLLVVPRHFFVPAIIEERKPLSVTARRAGWVGSNIRLSDIPRAGRLFLVENGKETPAESVRSQWRRMLWLREQKDLNKKGWLLDVLRCVEDLQKREFTLADLYQCEDMLSRQHPRNRHVKDKIRQQLQVLRNKGELAFLGDGRYRRL